MPLGEELENLWNYPLPFCVLHVSVSEEGEGYPQLSSHLHTAQACQACWVCSPAGFHPECRGSWHTVRPAVHSYLVTNMFTQNIPALRQKLGLHCLVTTAQPLHANTTVICAVINHTIFKGMDSSTNVNHDHL